MSDPAMRSYLIIFLIIILLLITLFFEIPSTIIADCSTWSAERDAPDGNDERYQECNCLGSGARCLGYKTVTIRMVAESGHMKSLRSDEFEFPLSARSEANQKAGSQTWQGCQGPLLGEGRRPIHTGKVEKRLEIR